MNPTPDSPESLPQPTPHPSQILPPPPPTHPATPIFLGPEGLRAGWSLLLFLLIFAALSIATVFITARVQHKPSPFSAHKPAATSSQQPKPTPPAAQLIPPRAMVLNELVPFALVLIATLLMSLIERRRFGAYGLGPARAAIRYLQGMLYGLVFLSLLVGLLTLFGLLHFDHRLLSGLAITRYGLIWLAGFAFVGFLEETLTRGYLQYTLARGLAGLYGYLFHTRHRYALGFWSAALILSFLFGFGHGHNPGESPIGLLSAGLAGLLFCFALYRTGSLWWALGFHATWDWAQSFLYGVPDSGLMVQGHLYATHPSGALILSGGLTGPEGSILILPVLISAAAVIFFTLPQAAQPIALSYIETPGTESA
jgi:membrane protease YdiL (CAAX protease family)